jgi:thioredoxin-like negative regulator of GroEL
MAASDLESKAKEAFVDDDFELAAELYTQAIDAGPATADLYADRAQAHIKLGNYTGAGSASSPLPQPDSIACALTCEDSSSTSERGCC